jgi:hypothetical protein
VIGRGVLEVRIDVGISPRVLNGVIGECLVKTHSIATMFTPRQAVYKILDFSDPILRKSLDFLNQFLLLYGRKYSTRLFTPTASKSDNIH